MTYSFDFGKFWSNNFFSHLRYQALLAYVNDKDAMDFHINRIDFNRVDENGEMYSIEPPFELCEDLKKEIIDTTEILSNQMLVYLATIIETVLEEYFFCIFLKTPSKINYCLKLREQAGINVGFSFNEFLEYSTKEDYQNVLARRAAKICNSGSIEKVIKRTSELVGYKVDVIQLESMKEIFEKRNKIVHENEMFNIDIEYFNLIWNIIDKFIKSIARNLRDIGIEVNDPGSLIDSK